MNISPSLNAKIPIPNQKHVFYLLVACRDPTPENGQISPLQPNGVYPENTTVPFVCDPGYNLIGEDSSTCQADETWDPQPPSCIESNEYFPSNCPTHTLDTFTHPVQKSFQHKKHL